MILTGTLAPDVNKYVPVTDWSKADFKFLGVRVQGPSDPVGNYDAQLGQHLAGAQAKGIPTMGYAFGHGNSSVVQQVGQFLARYDVRTNPLYVPMLDKEKTPTAYGKSMTTDSAGIFLAEHARRTGYVCSLYCTESEPRPGIMGRVPLWIARYRDAQPGVPVGGRGGQMFAWQYTNGVDGPSPHAHPAVRRGQPCDMNRLMVSLTALRAIRKQWPGRHLAVGVVGEDVRRWRKRVGIPDSNVYDAAAKTRCVEIQKTHALIADGVVGGLTWGLV